MRKVTDPKDLVQSRWSKWRLEFSRLDTKKKVSKILGHIIIVLLVAMLTCVVLNMLEYFSYDTTYGTMIKCEKVFDKHGDLVGYRNEYIVAYDDGQMTVVSSQVVDKLYSVTDEVQLYIKPHGDSYKVYEAYRTSTPLLVTTVSVGSVLLVLCILDILLMIEKKAKKKTSTTKTKVAGYDYIKGVKPDIIEYVEAYILPRYTEVDNGHGVAHIRYVLDRCFRFAESVDGIDANMLYVVATYHDVGHSVNPKEHEVESANIFMADETIKAYFSEEEQNIIKEAILDHRASGVGEPRSVYGKLVSSADRNTDIFSPLQRTYEYRVANYPDMPLEEMIVEARKHIIDKFGEFGYAREKMYFADPEYVKFLRDIRMLVDDERLFREMFIRVNNIKGTDIDAQAEGDK